MCNPFRGTLYLLDLSGRLNRTNWVLWSKSFTSAVTSTQAGFFHRIDRWLDFIFCCFFLLNTYAILVGCDKWIGKSLPEIYELGHGLIYVYIQKTAYICKSNDFSPAAQHYKFHGWRVVFLLWGKLVTRWVLQPVQHQRRLLSAPFFPHHSPWPHRRSLHGFALNTSHVLVSY